MRFPSLYLASPKSTGLKIETQVSVTVLRSLHLGRWLAWQTAIIVPWRHLRLSWATESVELQTPE